MPQPSADDLPRKSRIDGSRQEMTARYKGTCRVCQNTVHVGDSVYFFPRTRAVEHYNCTRRKGTSLGR